MALDEVPNEPYFIQVAAPGQIDFKRAAQLANVPLEEFRSLNPAYNRPVITPAGNGSLLIPADKAEIFSANLTKALDGSLVSWQTYRLTKHERLDVVAARFGTTAAQLQQVNGIKHHGRLRAGSTLLVPSGIGASHCPNPTPGPRTTACVPATRCAASPSVITSRCASSWTGTICASPA